MNKEKFYKAMVKRFGCIPTLTDYSSSAKNDISLDEALSLIPDDDDVVLTKEEYEALLLEQKRLKEMVDRIPCGYVKLADDEIVIKKDEYETLLAIEQKHVKAVVDRIYHDNAQKEEVDHLTITSKRYILNFKGFSDTPEMLFGKRELADE